MSEDDFLRRWSRRKRAAAAVSAPVVPPAELRDEVEKPGEVKAEFDLASLPSLDAITATTNVAAFLRKEVPLELGRAALRRAWTADPFIRDFVGLAENTWDFNDPNAIPGFGALDYSPEQLRKLLAQVIKEARPAEDHNAEPPASLPTPAGDPPADEPDRSAGPETLPLIPPQALPNDEPISDVASQNEATAESKAEQDTGESPPTMHRTHGGALPR